MAGEGSAEEFAEKLGDRGLLEGFLGFVPVRVSNMGSFGTGPWPLPLGTVEYKNERGDVVSVGVSSDPLANPGEIKSVPGTGDPLPDLRFGQAAGAFIRANGSKMNARGARFPSSRSRSCHSRSSSLTRSFAASSSPPQIEAHERRRRVASNIARRVWGRADNPSR